MKRILASLLFVAVLNSGCALNSSVPVLTPSAGTAMTNGLGALESVLHRQVGVPDAVYMAITDAKQAIAQDVAGTTWGGLLRTLLSNLYAQLPASVMDKPIVWASLAALEVALATIGA